MSDFRWIFDGQNDEHSIALLLRRSTKMSDLSMAQPLFNLFVRIQAHLSIVLDFFSRDIIIDSTRKIAEKKINPSRMSMLQGTHRSRPDVQGIVFHILQKLLRN